MKKKTTINGLAVSLLIGFAATSFAGQGIPGNQPGIGTEAGIDIVASDKALQAAANYNYDADQLAQIGTEAGIDVRASQNAIETAANYDYNPERLALVGTEAGYTSPMAVIKRPEATTKQAMTDVHASHHTGS